MVELHIYFENLLEKILNNKERESNECLNFLRNYILFNMGTIFDSLKKYFDESPQEVLDKDWEELKHWNEIGPDASEYIESCKNKKEQENKDLCKTCDYYWVDFIVIPAKRYIGHCEILDRKKGVSTNIDDEVSYPCLECPFNSYIEKKK